MCIFVCMYVYLDACVRQRFRVHTQRYTNTIFFEEQTHVGEFCGRRLRKCSTVTQDDAHPGRGRVASRARRDLVCRGHAAQYAASAVKKGRGPPARSLARSGSFRFARSDIAYERAGKRGAMTQCERCTCAGRKPRRLPHGGAMDATCGSWRWWGKGARGTRRARAGQCGASVRMWRTWGKE